jgi:putative FmdB family regulatory protein
MPIYEFRCCDCQEPFELIVLGADDTVEMNCPKCRSEHLERIMSSSNYCMGEKSHGSPQATSRTRTCPGGSCTTYDIPGPAG